MSDRHELQNDGTISHTTIADDEKTGIAGSWDARSGILLYSVPIFSTRSGDFSPDGSRFLITDMDTPGNATVQDAKTGADIFSYQHPTAEIDTGAFSPDATRLIITGTMMSQTQIWNLSATRLDVALDHQGDPAYAATFSPDGSFVLTSHIKENMRIWDAHSGKLLAVMPRHVGPAAISPDGKRLLTCSKEGLVSIREIGLYPYRPTQLSDWITCHVSYKVESERLVKAVPDSAACGRL